MGVKRIFFVLLLTLISQEVLAKDTYFDFSLEKPFIESGSEFEVMFRHKLEGFTEEDFLVSPVVNRGLVRFGSGKFSVSYPVSVTGFGKISLSFDIWNLKTGEIYKTPVRSIWSTLVYSKYIEKLNNNLRSFMDAKIDE